MAVNDQFGNYGKQDQVNQEADKVRSVFSRDIKLGDQVVIVEVEKDKHQDICGKFLLGPVVQEGMNGNRSGIE